MIRSKGKGSKKDRHRAYRLICERKFVSVIYRYLNREIDEDEAVKRFSKMPDCVKMELAKYGETFEYDNEQSNLTAHNSERLIRFLQTLRDTWSSGKQQLSKNMKKNFSKMVHYIWFVLQIGSQNQKEEESSYNIKNQKGSNLIYENSARDRHCSSTSSLGMSGQSLASQKENVSNFEQLRVNEFHLNESGATDSRYSRGSSRDMSGRILVDLPSTCKKKRLTSFKEEIEKCHGNSTYYCLPDIDISSPEDYGNRVKYPTGSLVNQSIRSDIKENIPKVALTADVQMDVKSYDLKTSVSRTRSVGSTTGDELFASKQATIPRKDIHRDNTKPHVTELESSAPTSNNEQPSRSGGLQLKSWSDMSNNSLEKRKKILERLEVPYVHIKSLTAEEMYSTKKKSDCFFIVFNSSHIGFAKGKEDLLLFGDCGLKKELFNQAYQNSHLARDDKVQEAICLMQELLSEALGYLLLEIKNIASSKKRPSGSFESLQLLIKKPKIPHIEINEKQPNPTSLISLASTSDSEQPSRFCALLGKDRAGFVEQAVENLTNILNLQNLGEIYKIRKEIDDFNTENLEYLLSHTDLANDEEDSFLMRELLTEASVCTDSQISEEHELKVYILSFNGSIILSVQMIQYLQFFQLKSSALALMRLSIMSKVSLSMSLSGRYDCDEGDACRTVANIYALRARRKTVLHSRYWTITGEVFTNAVRQTISVRDFYYTVIYPTDSRMNIYIPSFVGGYFNEKDTLTYDYPLNINQV